MADEIYYDPYDYTIDAHPHPMWKRMRDEAPLYYNEKFDFFAVTRYADVRDMSADWRTYSSHYGSVLELIDHPEVLEVARNMLFEDPPIHDEHRSVLARTFTPRRISNLEPQIRALCASYLDELPADFDFVRDYGARIPMMVIGMLLGVPDEDREHLRHLADQTVHRDEGDTDYNTDAQGQMLEQFAGYVALRREHPVDDIMSDLVRAEVETADGSVRNLSDTELVQYMSLVSAAGNETVANLMGWAGISLWRHPEQRKVLVDEPDRIPNAVEELLRYEAPSPIQARMVMRDVEVHGQPVPKGSKMALLTGSAGRDERVFADPDRFDVKRRIDQQLSFGHGIHFCLGAALARLEARVALEEMLARHPTWDVDEGNAEMVHTSTVRGWGRPVRLLCFLVAIPPAGWRPPPPLSRLADFSPWLSLCLICDLSAMAVLRPRCFLSLRSTSLPFSCFCLLSLCYSLPPLPLTLLIWVVLCHLAPSCPFTFFPLPCLFLTFDCLYPYLSLPFFPSLSLPPLPRRSLL